MDGETVKGIIYLIIVFLLTVSLAQAIQIVLARKLTGPLEKPEKACPPHKWTYEPVTEKMFCLLCNYRAGSDFKPRGSEE